MTNPHRRSGLTLIEVMIAMLILGSGLVAVASLFPVAGTVQRRSYDDVVVRQVGDSVTDLVGARGFHAVDMIDPSNPTALLTHEVNPVPRDVLYKDPNASVDDTLIRWGLHDRVYPTSMANDALALNRSFYWVPMVRKANLVDWHIYIFIMKKEPGVNYGDHDDLLNPAANPDDPDVVPRVISTPVISTDAISKDNPGQGIGKGLITDLGWGNNQDEIDELLETGGLGVEKSVIVLDVEDQFEIGDWILDSQGVVHRVLDVYGFAILVDGYVSPLVTKIWYSPRPPGVSDNPTRRILTFGNGVILK